jgi:hypothetical protein
MVLHGDAQSPAPLPHSSPRSSSSPVVPISGHPPRMRRGPRRSPLAVHGFLLLSPCFPSASLLLSPSLPRGDQQGGWAPRLTWRVPFGLQTRQGWRPRDRTGWSSPLPRSPVRGGGDGISDLEVAFPSGSVCQCGQSYICCGGNHLS